MASLTIINPAEIERILGNYDLGRLLSSEPMAGGLANSSMKIKTETGTYVLSVCDEKEMDEITLLCSVLAYLEQHDFPTTRVVAANDGSHCLDFKGKPLYLKHYIVGEVVTILSAPQLFEIGAALARLHEIPPFPGLPERFAYGIECFDELAEYTSVAPYYRWLSNCAARVEQAQGEPLPRGFVHGDLFFDNMVFSDGRLAALLDFEEACHYYRIFDLGMTAVGCCSPGGSFSLPLTAALVDGYESVRKLEAAERGALQLHIEYGAAATSFWRYRHYNHRNPDPQMKDHYLAMVDIARQVESIEGELFSESVFAKRKR